ncbi:hypothetical protein GGI07_003237 [Coemansia sp. Benny D115]|nr:hypothetical protein GGI07_003237 [Coemansia sp. Benny D115]
MTKRSFKAMESLPRDKENSDAQCSRRESVSAECSTDNQNYVVCLESRKHRRVASDGVEVDEIIQLRKVIQSAVEPSKASSNTQHQSSIITGSSIKDQGNVDTISDEQPTAPVTSSVDTGMIDVGHPSLSSISSYHKPVIHGHKPVTAESSWNGVVSRDAIYVDKSLEIEKLFNYTRHVVAGFAPRRSGNILQGIRFFFSISRSVVLVDEFDTPFVRMMTNKDLSSNDTQAISDTLVLFLSNILKGNQYLLRGVLVGVFNAPVNSVGSGLNNMFTAQAHTGLDDQDINPFQEIFGFSATEVWSLINKIFDTIRPCCSDATEQESDKKNALLNCFEQFDGYCYGKKRFVFNAYTVSEYLRLLAYTDSKVVRLTKPLDFWIKTGQTTLIKSLKISDFAEFQKFSNRLLLEFQIRRQYRYGGEGRPGIIQRAINSTSNIDMESWLAEGLYDTSNAILFLDGARFVGKDFAKMCMEAPLPDIWINAQGSLSATSVFSILYQAGYLTPLPNHGVGIPSEEVYAAVIDILEALFKRSRAKMTPLYSSIQEMGIHESDFVKFSVFLDSAMVLGAPTSDKEREKNHHAVLHAYLHPLTCVGYQIRSQEQHEGYQSDIIADPCNISSVSENVPSNMPLVVFEIKSLPGDNDMAVDTRCSTEHRKATMQRAIRKCKGTFVQITDRYMHSLNLKALNCKHYFHVCVTFWRQRFALAVKKVNVSLTDGGQAQGDANYFFTPSDVNGKSTRNVQFKVDRGILYASNICPEVELVVPVV